MPEQKKPIQFELDDRGYLKAKQPKTEPPKNGDAWLAAIVALFLMAAIAIANLAPPNATQPIPTSANSARSD